MPRKISQAKRPKLNPVYDGPVIYWDDRKRYGFIATPKPPLVRETRPTLELPQFYFALRRGLDVRKRLYQRRRPGFPKNIGSL
jgi:hypothetical protein